MPMMLLSAMPTDVANIQVKKVALTVFQLAEVGHNGASQRIDALLRQHYPRLYQRNDKVTWCGEQPALVVRPKAGRQVTSLSDLEALIVTAA
jgi:hypothetical protein